MSNAELAKPYFVGKTVEQMRAALDGAGVSQVAVKRSDSVASLYLTFPDHSILALDRKVGSTEAPKVSVIR